MLGWFIEKDPNFPEKNIYRHNGSNGRNLCAIWMCEAKQIIIMVATNQGGAEAGEGIAEAKEAMIKLFAGNEYANADRAK